MAESALQPTWLDAQGRKEGRYVIGPLLGHGAMGDVYEAWDLVLARPVALKILQHLEPAAMIRFMHEAQLHARLDIPNICRIYDVDAANGTPRIAMQLIRGPTLEDASPDLRLDEIVRILAIVAEAAHGAHQLNLIHRDIKPSNILLQRQEPNGWIPFICDFGLAMALDGPSVTQPLAMTGTPAYMAPEQVRGDRALVGPPTDVYGIGSTLYFTLVGRPPCVTTTTVEMLKVKRERRFPTPRSLEPGIPPALEAILFKCMEPAPRDRYATALELATELRRVLATLGAPPPATSLLARLPAWVRDRRLLRGLLAGAACLAITLPILAGYVRRQRIKEGEVAQVIALEASSLEQIIRNERLLPIHDLRPADTRTRKRMADLRTMAGTLGAQADGPTGFALGRAHYLLNDLAQAKAELGKAWSSGLRSPDAALLLAQIQYQEYLDTAAQADFLGQVAPPKAAQALAQAGNYLHLARLQTSQAREFTKALGQALGGNDAQAAGEAEAALKANPWHTESAVLGSACLARLAKERFRAGDADGAEARYREALDLAQGALARGQSDPRLHHAAITAALGLAGLALEAGDLAPASLGDLELRTEHALVLDPDNQDAQSDWLQVRALKALRLRGLGRDPHGELDQALQFYWSRTREPRSLALRMDHMVLYWLLAERDFDRGGDAGPSLAEALKDPGHTATLRDFQGDLWNFQARYEASRGQDPRPTLETVVAGFGAPGQARFSPEIAARAFLLRAEWELRHQIDPGDSLRRAQDLLREALERRPASASGHALLGQCEVLEAKNQPENRGALLSRAAENLRSSRQLNPADRDLVRLERLLPKP